MSTTILDPMFKLPEFSGKFFFSQDEDCHWYMIPIEKRERWKELNDLANSHINSSIEQQNFDNLIDGEFSEYRTNGGISHIEFTPAP